MNHFTFISFLPSRLIFSLTRSTSTHQLNTMMERLIYLAVFFSLLPLSQSYRVTPLLTCPSTTVFTYISPIYYHTTTFSTSSHMASAEETVQFDLLNSATSYSIYCEAEAPLRPDGTTSFDGSQGYGCSYLKNGTVYQENFQFDARGLVGSVGTGVITIVPTWSCLDGGVRFISSFPTYSSRPFISHFREIEKVLTKNSKAWMGLGNQNITFQCSRVYWQNPTWSVGQTFSRDTTTCTYSGSLAFNPPVVPYWGGNGGK